MNAFNQDNDSVLRFIAKYSQAKKQGKIKNIEDALVLVKQEFGENMLEGSDDTNQAA